QHITLSGYGNQKNLNGQIILLSPGTNVQVGQTSVSTDATGAGAASLPTSSPATVDVRISVPGYLSKVIHNVNPANVNTLNFGQLTPGDLNGDGIVNAIDYSIMASKFGQAYGLADFANDGKVDANDISILIGSWNQVGQQIK